MDGLSARRLVCQFSVPHDEASAEDRSDRPALDAHSVKGRPFAEALDLAVCDFAPRFQIHDGEIGVIVGRDSSLFRDSEEFGRGGACQLDEAAEAQSSAIHMMEHDWQKRLRACHSGGRVGIGFVFFLARVGRVVGADHIHGSFAQRFPQGLAVMGASDGRVHLGVGAEALIAFRRGQGEVLRRGFHAGEVFVAFEERHFAACGDVEDMDASACFFGEMEESPCGFEGGLGVSPDGVALDVSFFAFMGSGDEAGLVFGVEGGGFACGFEDFGDGFVFVCQERSCGGSHEDFDAWASWDFFHFGEEVDIVFCSACVEGVVAEHGIFGALEFIAEVFWGCCWGVCVWHIEDGCCSAEDSGAASGEEVFGGVCVGFAEMGLAVYDSWEDVEIFGVEGLVGGVVVEVSDLGDSFVIDSDIGFGDGVGVADGSAEDEDVVVVWHGGILH